MEGQRSSELPHLRAEAALLPVYQTYLKQLQQSNFRGDIESSYGSRLIASTDNSVYQSLPQAVLYPRDAEDLQLALKLAATDEFKTITFSPRGGGTGTNGQSLTQGLVIDVSRYLNQVLEINPTEGWVRVQAGVVKDQLNDALRPYGFFFSPDLSTSNRATLGGMINTDASGQGSLVYGKTSDHILSLSSLLIHGEGLDTQPLSVAEAEELAGQPSTLGRIYQQVIASCVGLREEIDATFPPLNRFLTGYDLKHAYDPKLQTIDLSRLLAGSEGTLGFIVEAKLNLTPIPQNKVLVNVKYRDFQAALRHAPTMVQAQATSVETIDSKVLDLARQDIIWHQVSPYLQDVEINGEVVQMDGINMVEFTGVEADEFEQKVQALCTQLDETIAHQPELGIIGYQVCREASAIQTIYSMRKKAVGLLGATKGRRKPVAFAEDTAVPPEKLADFILEFRALLDSEHLNYGMFGHVDAGVLHVRPALDLTDPGDEQRLRRISDQVVKLTAKYGGLMWGEHGKGYRSEYGPEFFGSELFTELRKIKAVFDPHNRINPGKICTPWQRDDSLVSVDGVKRGFFDRQIPIEQRDAYPSAMNCNGNGLCFNYAVDSPMCPSFKATGDRRYSPKGRAGLIREWLRLNQAANYDSTQTPHSGNAMSKLWRRISSARSQDFNHEVKQSMDECLACKACSNQCPVKVDVPTFRAQFYQHYYSYYGRPLRDYLVKTVEKTAPLMAKMPRLSNAFTHNSVSQALLKVLVGYVDAPKLSVPSMNSRWQAAGWQRLTHKEALDSSLTLASKSVIIVQDAFTSFYEAELVEAFAVVVEKLGYKPLLLDFIPNGKALHVKGFLDEFQRQAAATAEVLNALANKNAVMVGLDASTVLCFDDEYRQSLGAKRGDFQVLLPQQWLLNESVISGLASIRQWLPQQKLQLLSHCTEQTAMPKSAQQWQQIFATLGADLVAIPTGCCGMAGTYGHESDHQETSKRLFSLSWHGAMEDEVESLVTGFSCRSQVKRIKKQRVEHPLQYLAKHVQS